MPGGSGPTRRAACRSPACRGRSCARRRCTSPGTTSTATRSPSRPTNFWLGCSSTRSTTSTGCCWWNGSTRTSARRPSASCGPGPWACPTPMPTGWSRSPPPSGPTSTPACSEALAPVARLVFLGTPPAAAVALEALVRAGHDVALVVSRVDARRGRGAELAPSAAKRAALALGLDVTERLDDVTTVGAEMGVVVAYGRLIPGRILESLPMVNVHFSLLPRWRGAAPVERAVLAGDTETGVCLMRLEETLDTGPVLDR